MEVPPALLQSNAHISSAQIEHNYSSSASIDETLYSLNPNGADKRAEGISSGSILDDIAPDILHVSIPPAASMDIVRGEDDRATPTHVSDVDIRVAFLEKNIAAYEDVSDAVHLSMHALLRLSYMREENECDYLLAHCRK